MMFNYNNGRILNNREVIEIARQGGVAKCVIRDCYRKQPNGRAKINRAWEIECMSIERESTHDNESVGIRVGTQGSIIVDVPVNDEPFRQTVKGRGEVKLYYDNHTKDCGIKY